jgi:hypothetical protein
LEETAKNVGQIEGKRKIDIAVIVDFVSKITIIIVLGYPNASAKKTCHFLISS